MPPSVQIPGHEVRSARERLLESAYYLFSTQGIQAVGIDAIIERSGVARMTLYRHFHSKDDLVLAFLDRREKLWTQEWLQESVKQLSNTGAGRLLAIFDVFDGWFRSEGFEGCSFINVMIEAADPAKKLHQESARYLARIRGFLETLAAEAGIQDVDNFARQWHILMKGSIISAAEGDRDAAKRAQQIGTLLLKECGAL